LRFRISVFVTGTNSKQKIAASNVMTLRKLCVATVLLLAVSGLVSAQQPPCAAKLATLPQVPELRGFHLGMTPEQVKARVPQVAFGRTDDLGVSRTSVNPGFDPRMDKVSFADVRTVSLDFLDGRVTQLWIGFEDTFKWKTVDEFVKGISLVFSVPDDWPTKGRGRELQCTDFSLTVTPIAGSPSLRIVDSAAERLLATRRQAKADAEEAAGGDDAVVGDSKSKTYFPEDCELLKSVSEKNRVKFDSVEDAEKAGYKRAKGCE
jgi:hypothetical protein